MHPIQVGIIGFGLSGRVFQAPFLHSNAGFRIQKIHSSRIGEIKKTYPYVTVVQDVEEIFTDSQIDLVVVSSPNTTHYDYCRRAILNNKHVIVEKPFVVNVEEGQKLINIAAERNKIISVFHNRRWDGDFKTVQKIVASGQLGNIVEYEAHFDRYRPQLNTKNWRTKNDPGGGVFFDLGPHLIDQAYVLFGKPDALFADIRNTRNSGEVDDAFELILYYDNLRVKLKAGVLVKEPGPHFIVHGSKGSFVKYGMDNQEAILAKGGTPDMAGFGHDSTENYGILNCIKDGIEIREPVESEYGNYMGYFDNFYQAVRHKAKLEVTAEKALEITRIMCTALTSNSTKQQIQV